MLLFRYYYSTKVIITSQYPILYTNKLSFTHRELLYFSGVVTFFFMKTTAILDSGEKGVENITNGQVATLQQIQT